jgi:hypothetical protein
MFNEEIQFFVVKRVRQRPALHHFFSILDLSSTHIRCVAAPMQNNTNRDAGIMLAKAMHFLIQDEPPCLAFAEVFEA